MDDDNLFQPLKNSEEKLYNMKRVRGKVNWIGSTQQECTSLFNYRAFFSSWEISVSTFSALAFSCLGLIKHAYRHALQKIMRCSWVGLPA